MSEPEDDVPGVPEWVVTYGDMMSLLLTFFIMLVSLSELKSEDGRLRAALDAIREAFGATDGMAGVPGSSLQRTSVLNKRYSQGNRSEGGLDKSSRISEGTAGPYSTSERINHGAVITLGGPTVFAPNEIEISPQLSKDLEVICGDLLNRPNLIVVRGHTGRRPVEPTQFAETQRELNIPASDFVNVDVSFARALAVGEHMLKLGIQPDRLRIDAAGDTEPRNPSRETKLQDLNHRVDVFAIDSYIPPPNE
ncbi:MAG: OmpA family protein [Planctomycetaceae bacterium]|nr:OmpA family protein [Planctomycetaceae bacterium]